LNAYSDYLQEIVEVELSPGDTGLDSDLKFKFNTTLESGNYFSIYPSRFKWPLVAGLITFYLATVTVTLH
jgi:hypothetical protein